MCLEMQSRRPTGLCQNRISKWNWMSGIKKQTQQCLVILHTIRAGVSFPLLCKNLPQYSAAWSTTQYEWCHTALRRQKFQRGWDELFGLRLRSRCQEGSDHWKDRLGLEHIFSTWHSCMADKLMPIVGRRPQSPFHRPDCEAACVSSRFDRWLYTKWMSQVKAKLEAPVSSMI